MDFKRTITFSRQIRKMRARLSLMNSLRSFRTIRFLLATCVSLWLAGAGCLFGCSYSPDAVVQASTSANTPAVSGPSCHAMRSHESCAKKPQTKHDQPAKQLQQLLVNAAPSGMMSDCPLAVNQTAAVSQVQSDATAFLSHHSPLPRIAFANINARAGSAPLSIPNRGPTHVLHCVFLI